MKTIVIKKTLGFYVFNIIFGLLSFGIVPLILSMVVWKSHPRAICEQGLITQNGELIRWSAFTKVQHTTISSLGIIPVKSPIEFIGKNKHLRVPLWFNKNRNACINALIDFCPIRTITVADLNRGAGGGKTILYDQNTHIEPLKSYLQTL